MKTKKTLNSIIINSLLVGASVAIDEISRNLVGGETGNVGVLVVFVVLKSLQQLIARLTEKTP